jgi:hypothetical protein
MYWDFYGLYGIGEFDSIGFDQNARYEFKIYKKNYRQLSQYTFLCGKDPAVLKYLSDDPFGVKGSELDLTLINLDGLTPLSMFYAEEDDTFKIEFRVIYTTPDPDNPFQDLSIDQLLFTGFMIPEDSNEIMSDIGHEINLSFTDNLGTLKNIKFDEAAKFSPTSAAGLRLATVNASLSSEAGNLGNRLTLFSGINTGSPVVGDYVVLNDSPSGDVAYTIIKITTSGSTKTLFVREPVLGFASTSGVKLAYVAGTDPYNRIKLADAVRICLHATNQNLDVDYAGQLIVISGLGTTDWLNEVYVDGRTFQADANNFMSCYDVLQKLCERFQMSVFMANGKWHLIRWHELRYSDNTIEGRKYNSYLVSQSTGNITNEKTFSAGSIEEGLEQSIERPYNFFTEKFDYKADSNLLYNADLQILGPKLQQYTIVESGITYVIKEYESPGFTLNPGFAGQYLVFIRLYARQDTGEETERILVIQKIGNQSDNAEVVISDLIEINAGDELKLSFSYRTVQSQTNQTNRFGFRMAINNTLNDFVYLTNLTQTVLDQNKYVFLPYPQITGIAVNFFGDQIASGQNSQSWRDVSLNTFATPIAGGFFFDLSFLDQNTFQPTGETWYKNMRVEAVVNTAGQNVINGQEHKGFVNRIVKNNEVKEISVDDTQKNSIYGTLFLNAFQNLIQVRSLNWQTGYTGPGTYKLGEITTKQQMDWKYSQRLKFEGTLLGCVKKFQKDLLISFTNTTILDVIIFGFKNDLNFIFGKAEFNFREDRVNGTFFEMWKDAEVRTGLDDNTMLQYLFKYLYK